MSHRFKASLGYTVRLKKKKFIHLLKQVRIDPGIHEVHYHSYHVFSMGFCQVTPPYRVGVLFLMVK